MKLFQLFNQMPVFSQKTKLYPTSARSIRMLYMMLIFALGVSPTLAQNPGDPSGNGVEPTFYSDNPSCAKVYGEGTWGLKIESDYNRKVTFESDQSGVVFTGGGQPEDENSSVTLSSTDNIYFDWSVSSDCIKIIGVIVKGGPNANVYNYYPINNLTSDTDLHAPINPENGTPYGISHIEFCYEGTFDLNCPPAATVECDESTLPSNTGSPSVSDKCGIYICGKLTIGYKDSDFIYSNNCAKDGYKYKFTRTWTATDECGNTATCKQTIKVDDTTAPQISCPDPLSAVCDISEVPAYTSYTAFTAAGGSASDNCELDESSFVLLKQVSDGKTCPETVTRTYQIKDACGNPNTCTQTITIDDDELPKITCPPSLTTDCSIDQKPAYANYEAFTAAGGSASDNCGLDEESFRLFSEDSDGNTCPETVTRIYEIKDLCGNPKTCEQTITIDDEEKPTITCSGPKTILCNVDVYSSFDTPEYDDNCGATLKVTGTVENLDVCGNGTVTRTWRATDACENYRECSQTITINDCADFELKKLTGGTVDPSQEWIFTLSGKGSASTLNDGDGILFDNVGPLSASQTYTICEKNVPAGWSSVWKIDKNGDGVAETIVSPYNPDHPEDFGNRCFKFGAGTSYPLPVGNTGIQCRLVMEVNNTFPGGDPRTPGYWKNWSSCSGGRQFQTAAKNGGCGEGYCTLDDILNAPGISFCGGAFKVETCEDAVNLLDARDIKTGKKKANDAAFTLIRSLLAARLNFAAGAASCSQARSASSAAETLLCGINFNGTGNYLRPKDDKYDEALYLADKLDKYNNGSLCGSGYLLDSEETNVPQVSNGTSFSDIEQVQLNAYPNPTYSDLRVEFTIPESNPVVLEVFNLQGQRVARLISATMDAGEHVYQWDGNADNGYRTGSGVYLLRLQTGDQFVTKRIAIIR